MRRTASEIKDEMREEVRAHNEQVAQRTAQAALEQLEGALNASGLLWAVSSKYTREKLDALLLELDTYMTLLAECAASLPAEQTAANDAGKAA